MEKSIQFTRRRDFHMTLFPIQCVFAVTPYGGMPRCHQMRWPDEVSHYSRITSHFGD